MNSQCEDPLIVVLLQVAFFTSLTSVSFTKLLA